ncbi:MAG: cupin domain-containing protein [Pseudomonadota bacterium]|nr:cupin domain-containing protein [Pseudomonadota bacterium]
MAKRHDAALISDLEGANFQPLWDRFQTITPMNPNARDKAFLWKWHDIEPLTIRAGEEVAMEDAERRALIMCHPAFDGKIETTSNLLSAFTVLNPGDKAPPHRHTAAAIRFATQCEGAVTIVNGRRCKMLEGDLVLTPPMCWHGHINEGNKLTTWFDAANIPLIGHLDVSFFEPGNQNTNDFWEVGSQKEDVWEGAALIPEDVEVVPAHSPKYRYPGDVTKTTLDAMAATSDGSKTLRYTNPVTGGPVMPTLDCYYKRIARGHSTQQKRVTYNQICLVVNGRGKSHIGSEVFEWSKHDTFSIPHWTWSEHEAKDNDAEVFIVTDKPVFENLDLLREENQR